MDLVFKSVICRLDPENDKIFLFESKKNENSIEIFSGQTRKALRYIATYFNIFIMYSLI